MKEIFEIPELDQYFFLPEEIVKNLNRLEKLSHKHPINIMITGKQGCGKSSLVKQFAAYYKRPLVTFQVGLLSEPGQLFGEKIIKDGNVVFEEYLFPRAIRTEGCVIHLEEINRPEHPKALNELFSVLSEERSIWIESLGLQKVADRVIFFATLNEGPEFTGIEFLDAALRDRFYTIHLDYPDEKTEIEIVNLKTGLPKKHAERVVKTVNTLRNNEQTPISISTRHCLMIAELMMMGATLREGLIYSLEIGKNELESILMSLHFEEGEKEKTKKKFIKYI